MKDKAQKIAYGIALHAIRLESYLRRRAYSLRAFSNCSRKAAFESRRLMTAVASTSEASMSLL